MNGPLINDYSGSYCGDAYSHESKVKIRRLNINSNKRRSATAGLVF